MQRSNTMSFRCHVILLKFGNVRPKAAGMVPSIDGGGSAGRDVGSYLTGVGIVLAASLPAEPWGTIVIILAFVASSFVLGPAIEVVRRWGEGD